MDDFVNLPLLGKLLVLAILTPAWLPVLKELWKEVNASLVEEGGVFGEIPTEAEARKLAHRRRASGESLVSVPKGPGGRPASGPGPRAKATSTTAVQKPAKRRSF